MIVRRALVRLGIAMRQHHEAQLLVLVQLAGAERRRRTDGFVDEGRVGQQLLQQHANLLAAGGPSCVLSAACASFTNASSV